MDDPEAPRRSQPNIKPRRREGRKEDYQETIRTFAATKRQTAETRRRRGKIFRTGNHAESTRILV